MQEQEKVYISITCDKRQLTIDGDLSLFDRFLATLRSNKQVGAPTPLLRAVCLAYWRERTDNPQGDARGILHQLVIEGLRAEGIDFEDREHAAQLARKVAEGER